MSKSPKNRVVKMSRSVSGTQEELLNDRAIHNYIEDPGEYEFEEERPPLIKPMLGYRVELGSNTTHYTLDLEDKLKHSYYYKDNFSEKGFRSLIFFLKKENFSFFFNTLCSTL
eukprot:TRINITY_DN14749_c0_g1_i1.p1 TRINITY_DN14749_c0_g1~~TRINITY_DN14749_c0_g1_i1.p1  ORF type:complete len:113 (+),score=10.37 TRINITY_DN14749_c0_g1_i1:66-404(+)